MILLSPLLGLLGCGASTPSSVPPPKVQERRRERAEQAARDAAEDAGEPPDCPVTGAAEVRGTLANDALDEVSGLVKSRRHEVFWVHNDSGDAPRLYAVGPDGSDRGTFEVEGADAVDWEDMTLVPMEEGGDFLVLGDIGDNDKERESVQLYRVREPVPGTATSVQAERMIVRYPEGKARNAESLFVDPTSSVLYILTKSKKGRSRLLQVGAFTAGEVEAREVAEVQLSDRGDNPKATAADVSPDRAWLAVRTYSTVWAFPVDGTFEEALTRTPCRWNVPREPQGEALAFVEGGLALISEGVGANVHFVPLP